MVLINSNPVRGPTLPAVTRRPLAAAEAESQRCCLRVCCHPAGHHHDGPRHREQDLRWSHDPGAGREHHCKGTSGLLCAPGPASHDEPPR